MRELSTLFALFRLFFETNASGLQLFGSLLFTCGRNSVYVGNRTSDSEYLFFNESTEGTNGLKVDPFGEFLYVVREAVQRYPIRGVDLPLGPVETVYTFPKGQGGGDGCTFDVWGNFYSMRFKTGVIRVIDPDEKKLIAQIPVGVVPASNLTFGGPQNTELFVTAGAPKLKNCQVLKADVGVTGFCGHAGALDYPVLRVLDETANSKAFAAEQRKKD